MEQQISRIPRTMSASAPAVKSGKGKTIIIVLGALTVVAGVASFFAFAYKGTDGQTWYGKKKSDADAKKLSDELAKEEAAKATGTPYTPPPAPTGFPIKSGNRGAEVKRLQTALNNKWGAGLKTDGGFGKLTLAALRSTGYGDSVADEATLQNIEKHISKASSSISTTATPNSIGKNLWSVNGGTKVYVNDGKYSSVYKTVGAGQYIGKISGTALGDKFYLTGSGDYAVPVAGTVVK